MKSYTLTPAIILMVALAAIAPQLGNYLEQYKFIIAPTAMIR